FKKCEDFERGASEFRGSGGPIGVSDQPRHELGDAFLRAIQEAGLTVNDDCNGASREGFGYTQLTTRHGRRSSSAVEYLRPARKRPNLRVILRALTTRILFKDRAAVGVEFAQNGATKTIMARREVILCAGVFNSAQLLQLSGVGPAQPLSDL